MNTTPLAPETLAHYKASAAHYAVTFVASGMKIGLGTGSTAIFATRRIAELYANGALRDILAFPTSQATAAEAIRLGIPMMAEDMPYALDITIDGADEIDPQFNLIKGGGGALLREKIVAQASARVIIIADETKLSPCLGTRWHVPVEVIPFGWQAQARFIETLGARWTMRKHSDGAPFVTDSGNLILDCNFGPIADTQHLADALAQRAGIVEHGLFLALATDLIVAGANGIEHKTRARKI